MVSQRPLSGRGWLWTQRGFDVHTRAYEALTWRAAATRRCPAVAGRVEGGPGVAPARGAGLGSVSEVTNGAYDSDRRAAERTAGWCPPWWRGSL
ncbi:hypothetical protein GCM10009603_48590 [Nocardiopsis exhalans]